MSVMCLDRYIKVDEDKSVTIVNRVTVTTYKNNRLKQVHEDVKQAI